MRILCIAALVAVSMLAACAAPVPTRDELATAAQAKSPTNKETAKAAVVQYISGLLKDPESANYTFLPYINGVVTVWSPHMTGWFMCGTVNSKNSYGGYAGRAAFIAHFRSYNGDIIDDGMIEDPDLSVVSKMCKQLYVTISG